MTYSWLSIASALTVIMLFTASLYRGTIHQKIALTFIALVFVYQAHHYQNRALFTAIKNGELIKAQRHLQWGARLNARDTLGETPLMLAAGLGHADIVKLLIDQGADLSAVTQESHTALHYAVANGHTDIAIILIMRGAELNVQDLTGYTPLHYAITHKNMPLIKLLIQKDALLTVLSKDGFTPLSLAQKTFRAAELPPELMLTV